MLAAITGNIGSGKTTFARILERLGHGVFYADEFVSRLYNEKKILSKVRGSFGHAVFRGGSVDRKILAEKAFSSAQSLAMLNRIIHPRVKAKLKALRRASLGQVAFAELPVLFESGMEGLFDKTILVKCGEETAMRRAAKKGFSEREFRKRSMFQMPPGALAKRADFMVDSDCPISALKARAEEISTELSGIHAGKRNQ